MTPTRPRTARSRPLAAATLAALLVPSLAACDFGATATSRLAGGAEYRCNRFAFDPRTLDRPGVAERATDERTAALNAYLAVEGEEIDALPDIGWHLAGEDATSAEYVTRDNVGYWTISLDSSSGAWQVTGWGGCDPVLVVGGDVGAATWVLDPEVPPPDATATTFTALVTELACASGQSADGRISAPDIAYEADRVLVAFGVTPLPGAQDCPGNLPSRVTVQLREPLGTRALLDAGTWPPQARVAEQ